jgi:hypothetical protein
LTASGSRAAAERTQRRDSPTTLSAAWQLGGPRDSVRSVAACPTRSKLGVDPWPMSSFISPHGGPKACRSKAGNPTLRLATTSFSGCKTARKLEIYHPWSSWAGQAIPSSVKMLQLFLGFPRTQRQAANHVVSRASTSSTPQLVHPPAPVELTAASRLPEGSQQPTLGQHDSADPQVRLPRLCCSQSAITSGFVTYFRVCMGSGFGFVPSSAKGTSSPLCTAVCPVLAISVDDPTAGREDI